MARPPHHSLVRAAARLLAAAAAPAAAAPLLVSPTTVQLAPGRHAAVVMVENSGDVPAALQFTAFAWTQEDGADRLAETDAVVVSPAIATVPAHGRQLFRILERTDAPDGAERSYRLRLTELPGDDGGAVAVRVSFLLPMFAGGAVQAASPAWTAANGRLTVANQGGRRLRFAALSLRLADGRTMALPVTQPTYLLAGARRDWPLIAPAAGARLVGATDTGPFDVPAPAAAPSR